MWWNLFLIAVVGCGSATASYALGSVMSGNRMASVPLGRSLGDGELDVEGICTEPGMMCQNCTHAITCIRLPVGWLKIPLQQCPDGQTCNAHQRQCSAESVPECDILTQKYQHTCEQVGIFPDAYECRKFHLCSPPAELADGGPADHRVALCPRNYGYDPKTAQCSIPLERGQCKEKPVQGCSKVGEYGVLSSSPNHYYVCLSKHGSLYPQIFICPHGWYFWDNFCHPQPKPITESTTEIATEPTTKAGISRIESFFSTDKAPVYEKDTFLADKYDVENYEVIDDTAQNSDDGFINSFEMENDFW